MANSKVQKASEADLEEILQLQKTCYIAEAEIYNDFSIQPLTQTLESIREEFAKQTFFKISDNDRIIGSVRAFLYNGTCYVGKLIVDNAYQNQGFGRLLLETVEKEFDKAQRFELFTGSRSEKNLYLYNRLGYSIFEEETLGNITLMLLEKLNF